MDENKELDESKLGTGNQSFENPTPTPVPAQSNMYQPITDNNIPTEYTPITLWGYFAYSFLFGIPLIGFIITCVFAFGGTSNLTTLISRRNEVLFN